MSALCVRLLDLLMRPMGCTVSEAEEELGATAAAVRNMVRELRAVVVVRSEYVHVPGRGICARHFVEARR